MHYHLSCIIKY